MPGTSRRKSRQASSQAFCGHLPSPIPHPSSSKNLPGAPARHPRDAPWPSRCPYRGLQIVPAGARVSAPGRNGCMWSAMVALASRRPPGLRWWEFKSLRSLGDGVAVRCPDSPRARATQGPPAQPCFSRGTRSCAAQPNRTPAFADARGRELAGKGGMTRSLV